MKNTIALLALLCIETTLNAQNGKVYFGLEYAPNASRIRDQTINTDFKISHNAAAKVEYTLCNNWALTSGSSFLNTGARSVSYYDNSNLKRTEYRFNYNYIVVPLGIKYFIKKLFINPELGAGFNVSDKQTALIEFTNGETTRETTNIYPRFNKLRKFTIPFSLSAGVELPFRQFAFLVGFKGYYSMNKTLEGPGGNNRYYGLGVLTGVKF